jgi:hypothetical protein
MLVGKQDRLPQPIQLRLGLLVSKVHLGQQFPNRSTESNPVELGSGAHLQRVLAYWKRVRRPYLVGVELSSNSIPGVRPCRCRAAGSHTSACSCSRLKCRSWKGCRGRVGALRHTDRQHRHTLRVTRDAKMLRVDAFQRAHESVVPFCHVLDRHRVGSLRQMRTLCCAKRKRDPPTLPKNPLLAALLQNPPTPSLLSVASPAGRHML